MRVGQKREVAPEAEIPAGVIDGRRAVILAQEPAEPDRGPRPRDRRPQQVVAGLVEDPVAVPSPAIEVHEHPAVA